MQKAIAVAALASGQGKTIFTAALLAHFGKSPIRPFKIGPDYIDPQFHRRLCGVSSVNLDRFLMNDEQLRWMFGRYGRDRFCIVEGVMGFYDGIERGSSTYNVAASIGIPTVLVLDGGGSYSTLVAVMEGVLGHRGGNTIKAVVFNRLSSKSHFALLKDLFEANFPDIAVLGWIKKDLPSVSSRHLGLDLEELSASFLETLCAEVLENIDLESLEKIADCNPKIADGYPFEPAKSQKEKSLAVVYDENFSFLYEDNIQFLREIFGSLEFISATKDEEILPLFDALFIPGGYVETAEAYARIRGSRKFANSLKNFKGKVYAECAGLIYLGKSILNNGEILPMSGILDLEFEMKKSRIRLGYYEACDKISGERYRGHAFHYSDVTSTESAVWELAKPDGKNPKGGGWQKDNFFGTYLHSMLRVSPKLVEKYL